MKAATVQDIKKELQQLPTKELVEICLRLIKFKKDNKELLTYLLFEAHDEPAFVAAAKSELDECMEQINLSHLYFAKKTLRKMGRIITKYARYSGNKETEIQLRIYFCQQIRESGIPIKRNSVISNLYDQQLKKAQTLLSSLHEDLQYEYQREVTALEED